MYFYLLCFKNKIMDLQTLTFLGSQKYSWKPHFNPIGCVNCFQSGSLAGLPLSEIVKFQYNLGATW